MICPNCQKPFIFERPFRAHMLSCGSKARIGNINDQPMTRIQAEQLAYTRSRNDRLNNYIAKENCNGTWRVDSFPVHMHKTSPIVTGRD